MKKEDIFNNIHFGEIKWLQIEKIEDHPVIFLGQNTKDEIFLFKEYENIKKVAKYIVSKIEKKTFTKLRNKKITIEDVFKDDTVKHYLVEEKDTKKENYFKIKEVSSLKKEVKIPKTKTYLNLK